MQIAVAFNQEPDSHEHIWFKRFSHINHQLCGMAALWKNNFGLESKASKYVWLAISGGTKWQNLDFIKQKYDQHLSCVIKVPFSEFSLVPFIYVYIHIYIFI